MNTRFSVRDAAKYLGTCPSVVYALVQARAIPHYRVGLPGRRGRIVILQDDCDDYLRAHRVEAAGPGSVPARASMKSEKIKLRHLTMPS
jgi:excisionase family DNA binding protein